MHLLLFPAAEPSKAGVNGGLGLLAPHGKEGEEQQGQQQQASGLQEAKVASGRSRLMLEDTVFVLLHDTVKTGKGGGGFCCHDETLLPGWTFQKFKSGSRVFPALSSAPAADLSTGDLCLVFRGALCLRLPPLSHPLLPSLCRRRNRDNEKWGL